MAIGVVFEFKGRSLGDYDDVVERGGAALWDQSGRLWHCAYAVDDGFEVFDVWADEDSFAKFAEILMPHAVPVLGEPAPPRIFPVYSTHARGEAAPTRA